MPRLSHLAYITLGVISTEQPCTGYAVMRAFQQSASTYFSGSAGAIYPLLQRLESSGMIKSSRTKAGTRSRKHYALTQAGIKELKGWLAAPIPIEDVSYTVDLLRARVIFFANLSKAQRQKFIESARDLLTERIENREGQLAAMDPPDGFEALATQSVVMTDKARLEWVDMLERAFA